MYNILYDVKLNNINVNKDMNSNPNNVDVNKDIQRKSDMNETFTVCLKYPSYRKRKKLAKKT